MKKKFIQILMLLIATVSVGSFVSCKDTSEDLYNELRTQALSDNASLEEALNARLAKLDEQIGEYEKLLKQFKSCECDTNAINQLFVDIEGQIKLMNDTIHLQGDDLKDLKDLLVGVDRTLIEFLITLPKTITDQQLAIDVLEDEIGKLKDLKLEDKFKDIFDRLFALETGMKEANTRIGEVLKKAEDAQKAADAAQNAADAAQNAADAAQKRADEAWEYADRIQKTTEKLAEDIKKNADAITEATNRISALEGDIKAINEAIGFMKGDIKEAYDKADEAAKAASANREEIVRLQEKLASLEDKLNKLQNAADASDVDELKIRIAELEDKVSCHTAELATLEVEVGLILAESLAHFEAAKCYAKEQIELAKLAIMNDVNALLADYLKKGDIDLSNYVTKAEIANYLTKAEAEKYATKAELEKYVTKDALDALLAALEAKMTSADAALQLALQNLITQEIGKLKIDELRTAVAKNASDIEWLKTLYSDLNTQMKDFVSKDDILALMDKLIEKIGTNNGNTNNQGNTYTITDLLDIIVDLTKTDVSAEINLKIADIEAALAECLTKAELEAILSGYVKKEDIPDGLAEALVTLADLKKKIEDAGGLEDRIKALEDAAGGLADLAALEARVKLLESSAVTMDDLKDYVKAEDLKDYVTKAEYDKFVTETFALEKKALWDQINTNTSAISDLKDEVKNITDEIKDMKDDIKTLQDDVKANTDKLKELEEKYDKAIDNIKSDIKAIQDNMAKQVTGIIIQGTKNPMFGTFSIPVNIQSNVLLAYYGKPSTNVEFPTTDDANYVRPSEVLTAKDWEMISGVEVFNQKANKTLMNDDGNGNANAGKIYMTINPNTVDYTGLKLSIVNSQDVESPIKLSPVAPSNETLQFGYTRANNGFYEADAYISLADIKSGEGGLAFNQDDLAALYREAKEQIAKIAENFSTPGKQTDLEELAVKIYNVISKLKVDQSGLKCTYTDTDAEGKSQEHSVYSQYNLAASFMNPLNLAWGKDFDYKTMPGYEVVDKLLDDMAGTLKDHIDVLFKDAINTEEMKNLINGFKIDEMNFVSMSENYIAKFEARVSHITLDGKDHTIMVPAAGGFDVKFDKDLKASGSAVTVPDAVKYDKDNITLERAAIVIGGDINAGMEISLVVPATGGDGVIGAYATIKLFEDTAKATLAGGSIVLTTSSGTYTIAKYAGSAINTSSCTERVILNDVIGKGGSLNLPIVMEITGDLRKLLAEQVTTLDRVINDLNKILDRINSYNGVVDGWIDSYVDEYLKKYLNQINSDVVYFFNSINRRFGPFMVAGNKTKGFKTLSQSKLVPTELDKSELTFHPTSKTLELFVPLARKHVAVTNVFKGAASAQDGDGACKTALKKANTGKLNTVVDGTVRTLDVTGMESGYVYEVAYSVLDFEGNISTQKYYVSIK